MKTRDQKQNCGGFSLIEMSVATCLSVAAAGMVAGDFVGSAAKHRLQGAVSQITMDLRQARAAAVHRNLDVRVIFDSSGDTYSIWIDADRDGATDSGETVVHTLDEEVDIWSYPSQGTFEPEGTFSCVEPFCYLSVRTPGGVQALLMTPNGNIGKYVTYTVPPTTVNAG